MFLDKNVSKMFVQKSFETFRPPKPRRKKSGHLGNLALPTPQLNLANVAWNHVKIHMGERGAATGFVRFSDIKSFETCRGVTRNAQRTTKFLKEDYHALSRHGLLRVARWNMRKFSKSKVSTFFLLG